MYCVYADVLVVQWLSFRSTRWTEVKNLDEAVCISYYFWEGYESNYSLSSKRYIAGWTGLFNHGMETGLAKENSECKPDKLRLENDILT